MKIKKIFVFLLAFVLAAPLCMYLVGCEGAGKSKVAVVVNGQEFSTLQEAIDSDVAPENNKLVYKIYGEQELLGGLISGTAEPYDGTGTQTYWQNDLAKGTATTVEIVGGNSTAVVVLTGRNYCVIDSTSENLKISNLKLIDEREESESYEWRYIMTRSDHSENVEFINCVFEGGIALWNAKIAKVNNCIFNNTGSKEYAFWFGSEYDIQSPTSAGARCEYFEVKNCEFNGSRGIKIDGTKAFEGVISGNTFNINESGYEYKNYNTKATIESDIV